MRRGYLITTALVTTLRQGVVIEALDWPELAELDSTGLAESARWISATSLCSDGEIFLEGELPVEVLLRN